MSLSDSVLLRSIGLDEAFAASPVAQAVCTANFKRVLAANPAFHDLFGSDEAKLRAEAALAHFIDSTVLDRLVSDRAAVQSSTPFRNSLGQPRTGDIASRLIPGAPELAVLAITDTTERDDKARQLHNATMRAAEGTLRVYSFTEKVRHTPLLPTVLASAQTPHEVIKQAAEWMTDSMNGLNYASVEFWMAEGEKLVRRYPKKDVLTVMLPASSPDNPTVRLMKGTDRDLVDNGTHYVQIRNRKGIARGVLAVRYAADEWTNFESDALSQTLLTDLLRTIADLIGLEIENRELLLEITRQTIVDELTGVYNRRHLEHKLGAEVSRAARYGRPFSVISFDIDKFKAINDGPGQHAQGDRVLVELGRLLQRAFRTDDTICRYGGDEFVVLLPETDAKRGLIKANTLRAGVEAHKFTCLWDKTKHLTVTLSIGIAGLAGSTATAKDLLRDSDAALYASKRRGRNTVSVFPDDVLTADTDNASAQGKAI
jgi:diguanylate cyclase (GGDEF)-like protein